MENKFQQVNGQQFINDDYSIYSESSFPFDSNNIFKINLSDYDKYFFNNYYDDTCFNLNKISFLDNNIEYEKTNTNILLNKKIKREENIEINNNIISRDENNNYSDKFVIFGKLGEINNFNDKKISININQNEERKNIKKNNSKFGRKTQKEKDKGEKGNHTRDSEDNKIRKIKSFFGKSLYLFIKNSFKEKTDLLKLEIGINNDLKKDFNQKLFNTTLKDIYMKSNISEKYIHKDQNFNENLIKKIYTENKEIEVIKILNLTYGEAFDIFRRKIKKNEYINPNLEKKIEGTNILDNNKFNDIENLIKKIYKDEKNKNDNIEEYINDIINLCLNYEEWFSRKMGRNR